MPLESDDFLVTVAQKLATNPLMWTLIIARIVLGLAGSIIVAVLVYQQRKVVMHNNTKMVIFVHCAMGFLNSVATLTDGGVTLWHSSTRRDAELMFSGQLCFYLKTPILYLAVGQSYSFLFVALERAISTAKISTYERYSAVGGAILVGLQLLLPGLMFFYIIVDFNMSKSQAHCSVISEANADKGMACSATIFATEVFCIVAFQSTMHINKKMRNRITMKGQLTERYQVDENIRVVNMMLPLVYCHTIINSACAGMYALLTHVFAFNPETYYLIEEGTNQLHVYVIVMPLAVCLTQHLQRRKTETLFTMNGVAQEPTAQIQIRAEVTATHFRDINRQWN